MLVPGKKSIQIWKILHLSMISWLCPTTGQSFESQDLAQTCFQSPRKCKCQLSNITTCNFIVWLSLVITPNLNSSGNNGVITVSLPWAWSSKTPVPNANRIRSAKAASELSGVILKQDSKCIKFLLELRLKHLQSLNLISTQARLQLHILRFEGRKPLVHLITAHQWTLPHLHEWLLWPRHWVRHWDRWQVTDDRWQMAYIDLLNGCVANSNATSKNIHKQNIQHLKHPKHQMTVTNLASESKLLGHVTIMH